MWYAVNLLFEGCHPDQPPASNRWEERIILLDAACEDDARQDAEQRGKADECEYTSATGELVQWRFRGIERVHAIEAPALESGTEVFYRFLRASEVTSLLAPFHEDSLAENADNR
jgi:hypothetical protein